jgi:hypothetical protein
LSSTTHHGLLRWEGGRFGQGIQLERPLLIHAFPFECHPDLGGRFD